MSTSSPVEYESSILARLVADESGVAAQAAQFILSLRFPAPDQERMHELSEKARQGTLTPDEQAEAEGYERVGALLGLLKSKARIALQHSSSDADQSDTP